MKLFSALVCLSILFGCSAPKEQIGNHVILDAKETLGQKVNYCAIFALTDEKSGKLLNSSFTYSVEINGKYVMETVQNDGIVTVCAEEPGTANLISVIQTKPFIR
jgi:hypothetical protein